MIRLAFLLCLLAVPAVAQPVIWQGTQFDNNQLIEKSARSGSAPTITVGGQGSDANLSINITPKGTGTVNITNPAFAGNPTVTGTLAIGTSQTNSWLCEGSSGSPDCHIVGSGNQFAQIQGLGNFGAILRTGHGNALVTEDTGAVGSALQVTATSAGNPVQIAGTDASGNGIESTTAFIVQHNFTYSGTSGFPNDNIFATSNVSGLSANTGGYAINTIKISPSLTTAQNISGLNVWDAQQAGYWGPANALTVSMDDLSGAPTPPASWVSLTAYSGVGEPIYNGVNEYQLNTASCTSGNSGGPTGTGSSIADGSCTWKFVNTIAQAYYMTNLGAVARLTQSYGGSSSGYVGFAFGRGSSISLSGSAQFFSEEIGDEVDVFNTLVSGNPFREAIFQFLKSGNGAGEDWGLSVGGSSYNALIFQGAVMANGVGITFENQSTGGFQAMAGAIDAVLVNANGQFVGSSGYMLPGGGGYIMRSQNTSWLNSGDLALGNALFHIGSQSLTIDTGQFIVSAVGAVDGTGSNWTASELASDDQGNIFTVTQSAGVPTSVAISRTVTMASCPVGSQLLHALNANGAALDSTGGGTIPVSFHIASETCQQGTTLNIGNTTATTIGIGNSGSTTTINGTIKAGSGTGQSQTCTVNQAKTLIFTNGVLTGGTCNS